MKLGIIIICYNNAKDIDKDLYINCLNKVENLEICLVNNDSKDNTYDIITMIKEQCENASVVNVKKHKSDALAVRAGARYMFNQFNLKHLGYIIGLNNYEMNSLLETICENQNVILNYNLRVLNEKHTKQTLFQSIFSVIDYLKKLKINFPIYST